MTLKKKPYKLILPLLLCILQVTGIDVFAQGVVLDTLLVQRIDSLITDSAFISVADSIKVANEANLQQLEKVEELADDKELVLLSADSLVAETPQRKIWIPNSGRATWMAVVFPGGGQIYNRKYWKLPIVYGGFVGCAYALSWNNKMFTDYSKAYVDIMDKDPTTNSYYEILPPNVTNINEDTDTYYSGLLKRRKDYYRRFRDISIFAFIGVYLISIIDAYVDAELSNFDIGPDLSMKIEPTIITDRRFSSNSIGFQCSIRF